MSDRNPLHRACKIFSTVPSAGVRIESVEHSMVNVLASASDIALLRREDVPLNNISSLTKFAGYVIAGLPVIISLGVGDYSGIVESRRLGKVVDPQGIPGYAIYESGRITMYAAHLPLWRSQFAI